MAHRTVVVAIDLAAEATDEVVQRAALLTLTSDARVTLLHVVPPRLSRELSASFVEAAGSRLSEVARRLQERGLRADIRTEVRVGSAAEAIAACARELEADLVVVGIGKHAEPQQRRVGAVADRVVRLAHAPVLVVAGSAVEPYARPLVAVDLSPVSKRVLELARTVADRAATFDVLYAHSAGYLRELHGAALSISAIDEFVRTSASACAKDLRQLVGSAPGDVSWRQIVRDGDARAVILEQATLSRADLVAIGATGHSIVARLLIGSVTDAVLRGARCDVLLVR